MVSEASISLNLPAEPCGPTGPGGPGGPAKKVSVAKERKVHQNAEQSQ